MSEEELLARVQGVSVAAYWLCDGQRLSVILTSLMTFIRHNFGRDNQLFNKAIADSILLTSLGSILSLKVFFSFLSIMRVLEDTE